MKKIILTSALLIIIFSQSTAQKYQDILYLKNGSKIFGTLLEISESQYKLRVNDSTLFTFNTSEVEKYIKSNQSIKGRKETGLTFSIEAGFLIGPPSEAYNAPFVFNAILNYNSGTTNILGIGTGAEFLGKSYTPIFIEYKKLFHPNGVTPYIFMRGGALAFLGSNYNYTNQYSPQYYLRKNYSGGASFAIGTGISWPGDGIETNLSFAYRYAQTSYVQSEFNQVDATFKTNYNRLEIKIGFRF